jgi:glycosyltransferase involved in cell wall biosynthesis
MKILHIITTIERGGAENQLVILCDEQVKMGNEVQVFFLKGAPELFETLSNLGAIVNKLPGRNFMRQVWSFRRLIKEMKPDVIHAHLPRSELVSVFSRTKVPLVISRHNAEQFYPAAPRSISSFLSRYVCNRAGARIAISNSVRNFLLDNDEVTKEKQFSVIYYGYPFPSNRNARQSTYNAKMKSLLTISRLVPQKDLTTLLHGLAVLKSKGLLFRMVIVGDGIELSQLKKLSEDLDVHDSIEWTGRVEDTQFFYKSAELFILSSKYEGFGLVLAEAMYWNLPIICANNQAALEVLGNDYLGLFDVGNSNQLADKAIWALANSDTLLRQLQKRKDFFKAEVMAKKIQEIYSSII